MTTVNGQVADGAVEAVAGYLARAIGRSYGTPATQDRDTARLALEAALPLLAPLPVSGLRKALEATAEDWRYKSEDLTPWREGGGPGPDEAAYDDAAATLRKMLADYPGDAPAPAASLERVAEVLWNYPHPAIKTRESCREAAAALLSAGVFTEARPEAEVKAEALEQAADSLESVWEGSDDNRFNLSARQLRVRAADLRAGGQS